MTLHVETRGEGPELVLLHGWGVNSGVWQTLLPRLMLHYRVTQLDLPGHGASAHVPMPGSLATLARSVLDAVPPHAIWLGWSLGGLIALRAALDAPARIRALILSNTTPRFITAPDWPQAMPVARLTAFADELDRDYHGCLQRFLALQTLGDEHARVTLHHLRDSVTQRGEPQAESLATGLTLLRDNDLRAELSRLHLPVLVLSGEYDRVTPPQAGHALAQCIPGAQSLCISRAAHAPFISHPQAFAGALQTFIASAHPVDTTSHAG